MTASVPESDAASLTAEPLAPYSVRLPVFEGPLDLLLHLIRINEVEITDIPIARIGEQYVEYLKLMRELDLELVGEYLVMASTLAWIKSRMLLPAERVGEEERRSIRARSSSLGCSNIRDSKKSRPSWASESVWNGTCLRPVVVGWRRPRNPSARSRSDSSIS